MEITLHYKDETGNLQQYVISGSLVLVDFIQEIEYMQLLYKSNLHEEANNVRSRLAERLHDIMRHGAKDNQ